MFWASSLLIWGNVHRRHTQNMHIYDVYFIERKLRIFVSRNKLHYLVPYQSYPCVLICQEVSGSTRQVIQAGLTTRQTSYHKIPDGNSNYSRWKLIAKTCLEMALSRMQQKLIKEHLKSFILPSPFPICSTVCMQVACNRWCVYDAVCMWNRDPGNRVLHWFVASFGTKNAKPYEPLYTDLMLPWVGQ